MDKSQRKKGRLFIEVKPKRFPIELIKKDWSKRRCFNDSSQEYCDEVFDFQLRNDDVWLVTLPKSGTTWMQELTWLVLHNYNFESAKQIPLELRSPYFEFGQFMSFDDVDKFNLMTKAISPRLVKTHFPLPLLPQQIWNQKTKVIYVVRDPKDALVSGYHIYKNLRHSKEDSLDEVILQTIATQRDTNAYFQHIMEFYQLRHEPWVLYTSFERMKSNLEEVILEVCQFLDRTISKEQMKQMLHHLSFAEMKKNPQCSHMYELNLLCEKYNLPRRDHQFIRKGEVSEYKNEISPNVVEELNKWIEDSLRPYNVTLNDLLLLNEKN